jgi:hypothetical protein
MYKPWNSTILSVKYHRQNPFDSASDVIEHSISATSGISEVAFT